MAVYIDPMIDWGKVIGRAGPEWCHMIADSLDELEVFVSGHDWLDDIATMRRYLGVDESGTLPDAAALVSR